MGEVLKKETSDQQIEDVKSKRRSDKISNKVNFLTQKIPVLGELFEFQGKIGEGTFSCVYLLVEKEETRRKFALKHLIPTCHPSRILRELCCMREMGGKDNVAEVYMCLRKDDCIAFVMPYHEHDKFTDFVLDMTIDETRLYLKQLLIAVRRVHSFGIIHRDIKPGNFLYNRKEKKFLLVDFGLAQKVDESTMTEDGENIIQGTGTKRKRDEGENQEPTSDVQQLMKRQALQQLSSNFTSLSESITKRSSEPVKRFPFQSVNRTASPVNFVRVQNSQVVTAGGERVFAKPQVPSKKCQCDGRPRICNTCLTRKSQATPRAGTPGFRPPEVLLKTLNQTTAVDIWAVGVMLLCIMSGTYPFFRSPEDVTALAEVITIFGTEKVKEIARKLGRNIVCSEDREAVDLRRVCERLRRRRREVREGLRTEPPEEEGKCGRCRHSIVKGDGCLCPQSSPPLVPLDPERDSYPQSAYHLLSRLLDLDPATRITADQALNHPFITSS